MEKEIASYNMALQELQETLEDLLNQIDQLPLESAVWAEDLVELADEITAGDRLLFAAHAIRLPTSS